MIWLIPLVLLTLIAYLIFRMLRGRHIARSTNDARMAEHKSNLHSSMHNDEHATSDQGVLELGLPDQINDTNHPSLDSDGLQNGTAAGPVGVARTQPLPPPHSSPSLLYGGRHQSDEATSNNGSTTDSSSRFVSDATQDRSSDAMDLTAETTTLSSDEVGLPANSSDYNSDIDSNSYAQANTAGSDNNQSMGLELGEGEQLNEQFNEQPNVPHIDLEENHSVAHDQSFAEDHDEVVDFGDMTVDISEMIKELNLRETDSPRLELEPTEYQQLKTGDPGEVNPEKIENVAGKLRNMLQ